MPASHLTHPIPSPSKASVRNHAPRPQGGTVPRAHLVPARWNHDQRPSCAHMAEPRPLSGLEHRQCSPDGMAALDLNSHGEGWPRMAGYEGHLLSGPLGGGIDGSMGPPPVRVHSGSRTLDLRTVRTSVGGGATAARALSSSSSGGRGPPLPPMTAGVRASRGSTSGAPAKSRSRGGRR